MQTKETKQNHIFVAFPGMGKTTYALSNPGIVDLDFGNFRSALKVPKTEQNILYYPFQNLAKYYFKDGFDILTNDQGLIPFFKQFAEGRIIMVLPIDEKELVARVKQREAKRSVNPTFPKLLEENIYQWIDDWSEVGSRYHIPISYVHYLKEVADEYR